MGQCVEKSPRRQVVDRYHSYFISYCHVLVDRAVYYKIELWHVLAARTYSTIV